MRERGTEPQKGAQSNEGDKENAPFSPMQKVRAWPEQAKHQKAQ